MLLEIVLLVIAVWFVFGAGFWGLFVRLGFRFEPRRRTAVTRGLTARLGRRAAMAATAHARRAERDPLPERHAPLTWA